MIKLRNKDKAYSLPTGWSEVTFIQWKTLKDEKDEFVIISILTGIPIEMVKKLGDKTLFRIINIIQFINTPIDLDDYKTPESLAIKRKEIKYIEDITEASFGQKIYLQQMLKDSEGDIINSIEDIVLVYSQPLIDKGKFDINRFEHIRDFFNDVFLVDLYATALGYVTQLKEIIEIESANLKSEPNTEQKLAGVDMFNEFGVMNTVKALAGGGSDWALNAERVLELEYNVVFLSMKMNKVQNDFNENYRKVLERKNKR